MDRDASLDDFLDGTTADEQPDDDAPGRTDSSGRDGEDSFQRDGADAGRSTFDWSPDGAPCAACGARVERRWRGDGGLVCESCKTW
ncbi:MAG: hypothetical protein ABEJ23_04490 [Haloarculaceae archaeon]